jgi:hypothetical protein
MICIAIALLIAAAPTDFPGRFSTNQGLSRVLWLADLAVASALVAGAIVGARARLSADHSPRRGAPTHRPNSFPRNPAPPA